MNAELPGGSTNAVKISGQIRIAVFAHLRYSCITNLHFQKNLKSDNHQ